MNSQELVVPSKNVKLEKENSELKDLVHKLIDNDQCNLCHVTSTTEHAIFFCHFAKFFIHIVASLIFLVSLQA